LKYLCIIYASGEPHDPNTAEQTAITDGFLEQDHALFEAGKLIVASPLQAPQTGVAVRYREGKMIRTDGPFLETKEWIAGFMVIQATDIEEAIAIASEGPLEGILDMEIRPLLEEKHSRTGQDRSVFFRR
jgi:hypothetical protein